MAEPILDENTCQLYRDYADIKDPKELAIHLVNVQTRLAKEGKIHYRCIQRYKFAFSRIYERFFYRKLIAMAQQVEKPWFLDIGCCTGTDVRKLLLDGYPSQYLMGLDIEQSYIDCGYMLFKDSPETCPIQFIVDTTDNWQPEEKMFVVHAGSVFHLFMNGDTTKAFIKRIVKMLRPGGILIGGHVCTDQSMQYYRPSTKSLKFYMGLEDFKDMLISEGFSDIEIETMPRLGDEEEDFKAFWISFYAVYHPISSK